MANMVASLIHTITTHTGDVNCIAFTSGKFASGSGDKTVRLWSTDDFTELPCSPLLSHSYTINDCAFSPFGAILATCSTDGKLILWDVKTGNMLASLKHPSKISIRVCQFSPDGSHIASGSDDNTICLWEVASKKLVRSLSDRDESVVALAYSPDGNFLVSGNTYGELHVWDATFGHGRYLVLQQDAHDLGVTCCRFSPTFGSASNQNSAVAHFLLATCGKDNLIKLWTFTAEVGSVGVLLKCRDSLSGHSDSVLTCAFSPSGRLLASGSLDKTVRIWDPIKGITLFTIDAHVRVVLSCAFSLDESLLATGSNDRTIKIWKLTDTSFIMDGLRGYEEPVEEPKPSSTSVDPHPMGNWSIDDVSQWLATLGLEQYQTSFKEHAIDGAELMALTSSDLEKSLGVLPLGHRNKILRNRDEGELQPQQNTSKSCPNTKDAINHEEFLCPITHEIMRDPVIAADGYTYDRTAITAWFETDKDRSPMTNAVLTHKHLTPNRTLKMLIQKYLEQGSK